MNYPTWTNGVHHDGSALYVSNPLPTLDERVTLKLRVPAGAPLSAVFIRSQPDGEQHFAQMKRAHTDEVCVWYSGVLPMRNPRMPYRFKLMTAAGAFYYNAAGISRADPPDVFDFKLIADFESPSWVERSVFYQIFPDRFYNGDPTLTTPEGEPFHHPPHGTFKSRQLAWEDAPLPFDEAGTVDFFGGDLPGIEQKLDYLQDLGVNALYLNPIFTSPSNHKYNISDFYSVDPHFGGDEALVSLANALHAKDMRYVLDITPNHTGDKMEWFVQAKQDRTAPTAEYYTFHEHPNGYESWLGIDVLPKLNYTSARLRQLMFYDEDAVMRYWLKAPFHADGWRLDVWNMTARQHEHDAWQEIGQALRQSVKSVKPEAYVFGENFFDATPSLQGDQLDAAMNYQGFSFPLWRWLSGHDYGAWREQPAPYADPVPMPAEAAAEQMQNFMALIPWAIARLQFNQLGSHDTPRILSVLGGDTEMAKLAAVVLFTFPGVPCVYYGDEIGMEGWRDPDNRHPMRWDANQWDTDLLAHHKRLIALRRESDALQHGGFQFLHTADRLLAYQRESDKERVIVVAYAGDAPLENVRIPVWHGGIPDGTSLTDALMGQTVIVQGGELLFGTLAHGAVWVLRAKK